MTRRHLLPLTIHPLRRELRGSGGIGERNYIRGFALCVSIPYPVPMHLRAVPHVLHSGLRSGLLIAATLA